MKRYLFIATAIVATVGAGVAVAVDDGDVINACALNINGQLRIVDDPDACKSSEYPVSWNAEGIKGDQGDPGLPGEDGAPGPEGPPGPPGVLGFYESKTLFEIDEGEHFTGVAECDPGDQVTGGGFGSEPSGFVVQASFPFTDDSWRMTGQNNGADITVAVYALCADLTP